MRFNRHARPNGLGFPDRFAAGRGSGCPGRLLVGLPTLRLKGIIWQLPLCMSEIIRIIFTNLILPMVRWFERYPRFTNGLIYIFYGKRHSADIQFFKVFIWKSLYFYPRQKSRKRWASILPTQGRFTIGAFCRSCRIVCIYLLY